MDKKYSKICLYTHIYSVRIVELQRVTFAYNWTCGYWLSTRAHNSAPIRLIRGARRRERTNFGCHTHTLRCRCGCLPYGRCQHYTWQIDAFIAPCTQYTLKRGRSLTLLQYKCIIHADRQMAPVCLQIAKAAKSAAPQLKN